MNLILRGADRLYVDDRILFLFGLCQRWWITKDVGAGEIGVRTVRNRSELHRAVSSAQRDLRAIR